MTTDIDSMNERAARAFARDAYRQMEEMTRQRDELREACERLLEEVSDPRMWGRYVDRARAAIAKAKGEQHARGRAMIRGDIWECDCPECSKRLTLRHLNPLAFCSSCTTWYSVDWREGDLHGLSRTIAKAKGE